MTQSNELLSKFGALLDAANTIPEVTAPFEVRDTMTHKLTFIKGRAKNFRSVGNQFMEIDYQRNSATLVTSDDNGAGKSTMLVWLLFFVLYNDTYSKKEKKAGLVNSQSKKECVGEVEFSCRGSEWLVRRGIKPDFVEVHQKVDGEWKQVVNDAAKADMNKYIVNLIGVDQKMFENSLVLGKEKFIPFTEMYTSDRRAMVESIWDLGFFSLMNEEVKAEIKTVNGKLEELSNQIALKVVDHTNKKTQLAQIIASNELIQQQSAEILVQEQHRLASLDADIEAQQAEQARFTQAVESAKGEIAAVVERVDAEVLKEVDVIKKDFAEKIQKVDDETTDRAEDYERVEVSATRQQANHIKTQIAEKVEEKNAIVNERVANQSVLQEAIGRRQKGEGFRARFTAELEIHTSAIKKFHDMGTCPTCTQVVSDETKAGVALSYQPQIDEVNDKSSRLEEMLTQVASEIENHQALDDQLVQRINLVDADISALKEQLADHERAIQGFMNDIEGFYKEAEVVKSSLRREMEAAILNVSKAANQRVDDLTVSFSRAREDASKGLQAVNDKIGELKGRRAPLVASIADLERKLAVQPTPTTDLEAVILGIETSLSGLSDERLVQDELLQDLNHVLYFLKDDQTKARIISLYLPFLNSKINEYLEAMNMFLDIQVDDTFDITMGTAGRKGQSLFSLSSGQRVRVNIAITMALRDVANLKASVQCNILVFDEVLENLSERGVQECIEMLKYKFSTNNLFVISQREQEFQEYFQHNIRYGLRNGQTEIISKE